MCVPRGLEGGGWRLDGRAAAYTGGMKTSKQALIELIEQLPEGEPFDALLLEVKFKASVLRGLAEAERGEGISQDDVEAKLAAWLKSSGRRKLSET